MALPNIPLPTNNLEIGGVLVSFRSLSRKEALKATTDFKEDPDGAEVFFLMCGTGCSKEEAEAWRDATAPQEAGKLIDGIIYLTGLAKPESEDEKDPKV